MKNNKNIVIIGGGLPGLIGALLLKKIYKNVYLIEQNKKLGGLFRSRNLYKNLKFDYGSHFIKETGIKIVDQIIFGKLNKKKWHVLGNLRGASFFKNKLNDFSSNIDLRLLPPNIYKYAITEIIKKKKKKKFSNLRDQIKHNFGNILLKKIFEPIISKKSYGCSLKDLNINAHSYFGLDRVMAFNHEKTIEIKKQKYFDNIFAFHNYFEGQSENKSIYPVKGGSGFIVDRLVKQLKLKKIKILTNTKITNLELKAKKIESITLNGKRILTCDKLIWTLPPSIFLNYISKKIQNVPNQKFYVSLHHFAFSTNYLIKSEYLNCHDPKMKTYRITMYSNIKRQKNDNIRSTNNPKLFHLTVEAVQPTKVNLSNLQKTILKEIFQMNVVSRKSKVKFKYSEYLGKGIPTPTVSNFNSSKKTFNYLQKRLKNLIFTNNSLKGNSTGQLIDNIYNMYQNEKKR